MKEQLLTRKIRNFKPLSANMDVPVQFGRLSSFFTLMAIFVFGSSLNVEAQKQKAVSSKNVISTNISKDWTNGLVKVSGYENGFETEKFLDPEFYDSKGNPKVDFTKMKNSPTSKELRLTGSGCLCSFNLTSNWDFNGGTSNSVPNNWTP